MPQGLVEQKETASGLDSVSAEATDRAAPFAFNWALADGGIRTGETSSPMPSEIGEECGAAWSLGAGVGLCEHRCRVNRPVSITGTNVSKYRHLVLRVAVSSKAELSWNNSKPFREQSGQYSLHLYNSVGDSCAVTFAPNEFNTCMAPVISDERLRLMLDGQRVPKPIARFLDGHSDNFFVPPQSSLVMRRITEQIRSNPYTGAMSNLFLQGKTTEMLAEALTNLAEDDDGNSGAVSSLDRRRVTMVRDMLMADPFNFPSMDVLAAQVGLSQKRLNGLFREVYGMTVYAWLVEWRLNSACDLLREGAMSIKEIAFSMGYAHVSNFTAAFTRRFGVAPAAYRETAVSTLIGGGLS